MNPNEKPNPVAPRVLRLPLNENGRDFIVGDIHGAFDLVVEAMKKVSFNRSTDRIISVGDLIDRGPQSARVIRFLESPYVFAVRGNHEQNLLSLYEGETPDEDVLKVVARMFNMEWWLTTSLEDRQKILDLIGRLPVVMEIETRRGVVGVVHGDVPVGLSWPAFVKRIEAGDPAVLEVALEGRKRLRMRDESGVEGVGRVYVGHSIQQGGPKRLGNVFAVDTGAILNHLKGAENYALTFANIACRTESLSTTGNGDVPSVIAFEEEDFGRPFGCYVGNAQPQG